LRHATDASDSSRSGLREDPGRPLDRSALPRLDARHDDYEVMQWQCEPCVGSAASSHTEGASRGLVDSALRTATDRSHVSSRRVRRARRGLIAREAACLYRRRPASYGPGLAHSIRLAEVVAALSLGIDLGFGQPMEHVLRQCLIALRLGELLGLDERGTAPRLLLRRSS
jgi:hypothetical protein